MAFDLPQRGLAHVHDSGTGQMLRLNLRIHFLPPLIRRASRRALPVADRRGRRSLPRVLFRPLELRFRIPAALTVDTILFSAVSQDSLSFTKELTIPGI